MENYLDPEEEFMLMHQDEMELMDEIEQDDRFLENLEVSNGPQKRSKRSLDFGKPENHVLKRANSIGVEPMASNSSNSESDDRLTSAEKSNARKKSFLKRSVDAELSSTQSLKDGKENYEDIVDLKLYKEAESTSGTASKSFDDDLGRKRSVDYLFGDIDDIEMEEARLVNPKKKARNEPETGLYDSEPPPSPRDESEVTLFKDISSKRKVANAPMYGRFSQRSEEKSESEGITYGVPKWPFIVVTNADGSRLYVRLNSEAKLEKECNRLSVQENMSDLLSEPYSAVKADATLLLAKRQMEMIQSEQLSVTASQPSNKANTKLWVEKYKPKVYSELLSDATINRTLLQWLKLWDKVVFDIDVKPKPKKTVNEDKKGQWNKNRGWNKNPAWNKKGGLFVNEELDENGCPAQKVVLLCGPPGLGKTTLAFIVARKAGYNVVEMNASDDRSPETFRTQLEAATQMTSVMGRDPRPNCLVLDEIDGAPAPSIDVLVKFVGGKETAKTRGKKKEARGSVLKRPILCICNDPYVPALRALRQIALIVNFPQTSSEVLSNRLLEIARKERIRTDLGAMLALCEKSQNDIRSCLSSLFYYKTKGGKITLSDILRSNVGQKDVHKGLFAVWQDIFQVPRAKGARTVAFVKGSDNAAGVDRPDGVSVASRMDRVMNSVQTFGDYERLAMGVFENYPNMKFRDSSMTEVSIGTEWFCRMDLINTHINSMQDYTLMPYLPFAFSLWHILFAMRERPKIMYPNASYEASVKLSNVRHIVDDVMKGMSPAVRAYTNRRHLVLEVLPYLTEIIVPVFRPVSLELYSLAEKQSLQNVVNIMIDYNLSYVQERTQDSLYISKLDPNILDVVYGGQGAPVRKLTHTAKQILSREIEREKMRRLDIGVEGKSQKNEPCAKRPGTANKPVPLTLEQPKFKSIIKETVKKDFFGRIVSEPDSPRTVKSKAEHTVKGNIWFHFKEGFNNAVRRRIKMEALM